MHLAPPPQHHSPLSSRISTDVGNSRAGLRAPRLRLWAPHAPGAVVLKLAFVATTESFSGVKHFKYRRSRLPSIPPCHPRATRRPLYFALCLLPLTPIFTSSSSACWKGTTLSRSLFFHRISIAGSTRSTKSPPFKQNAHCAFYSTSHNMDSMPIRIPSTNNLFALKQPIEAPKSKHVENASPPTDAHEEHLPRGIQETDQEKKEKWFIGSIDCGTTSSRFLIFNGEGMPIASHQIEFENIYPQSGSASIPKSQG